MNTDTPDILKKIVETEQNDLITRKSELPIDELEDRILSGERPYPLNFAGTLMGDDIRVIAEIKRATPSKGVLRDQINPLDLANTYAQNGAAAVSILTNNCSTGLLQNHSLLLEKLFDQLNLQYRYLCLSYEALHHSQSLH